ncbi:hypothetical protein [Pseudomonas phage Astolliot]|nr:hypothetical protein [Pseudomonas phage Astolliot]
MLEIKDIKNSQRFWGKDPKDGKVWEFKAWQAPFERDGKLWIECTDAGDYIYEFDETDAYMLYATEQEANEDQSQTG